MTARVDTSAARTLLTDTLLALRNPDGGWPYYRGRRSRLEPTSWALLATGTSPDGTPLASWAEADGLLVEPTVPHPNLAFNALAALALGAQSRIPPAYDGILRGLIAARGESIDQVSGAPVTMDSTLQGWPWMAGTFSWVEPTAWCTLALKRARRGADALARVAVGERLLRDRVGADGGWNYGNAVVFGKALPSHAPPTAAAILALQDHPADAVVTRARAWLATQAPREGSTTALALATLAARVLGEAPADLSARLVGHAGETAAFGNAATIAMALCALAEPHRLASLSLAPMGQPA